jgi:quercetin dioxygenase-like cupin family protein
VSSTAFTITNLMDLEDSAGKRSPEVEGRFAREHLNSDHLGVSYFRYAAGFRSPIAHSHREQEEAYVVTGGSGSVLLDGEVHPLKRWDVLRVSAQTVRAFEAGAEGLEFIAIGSDRPEGGDGQVAEAAWAQEVGGG